MVISYNSQLGLRFREPEMKVELLDLMKDYLENELGITRGFLEQLRGLPTDENGNLQIGEDMLSEWQLSRLDNNNEVRNKVSAILGVDTNLIDDDDSLYYFICDSVYKAAELIRINDNFSGRTIKDINFGKYTYLMGKNRMVRFVVRRGVMRGFYFNDSDKKAFEFGIEMEDGGYFFQKGFEKEFSTIMQVLTFVELGDIEIKILEAGRNNGGKKNVDKVTNTSNKTVYVVDSSWNQIIIRTTGFAVRGHFRLQSCGEAMKDRKLIWINAFEKHGYKRRPTGEIVREYN